MLLGPTEWDYDGPSPCPHTSDRGALHGFVHDVRCWGWRTAVYNLAYRVFEW